MKGAGVCALESMSGRHHWRCDDACMCMQEPRVMRSCPKHGHFKLHEALMDLLRREATY